MTRGIGGPARWPSRTDAADQPISDAVLGLSEAKNRRCRMKAGFYKAPVAPSLIMPSGRGHRSVREKFQTATAMRIGRRTVAGFVSGAKALGRAIPASALRSADNQPADRYGMDTRAPPNVDNAPVAGYAGTSSRRHQPARGGAAYAFHRIDQRNAHCITGFL